MPPDECTLITISDETATKLAELVVIHNLESVAEALEFVTVAARDLDTLLEAELARLRHIIFAD